MKTFKIVENIGKCEFEEWSKEKGRMVFCSCKSKVMMGKQYVCNYHLPFALATDRDPRYKDLGNKEINCNKYGFKKIVESLEF